MQSIGYWDAWSQWWLGEKLDDMQMWGVPILGWGRAGKLMQFFGGLIVVLDIIGFKKLERTADKIQSYAPEARRLALRLRREGYEGDSVWPRILSTALALIISLPAFSLLIDLAVGDGESINSLFSRSPIYPILFGTAGLVILVAAFAASLWILSFVHLPIRAVSFILKFSKDGHPARWVAFAIVVVGFHFDLLAS